MKGDKGDKGARSARLAKSGKALKAARVMEKKVAVCAKLRERATPLGYSKITQDKPMLSA
jgi:hypothetical protein